MIPEPVLDWLEGGGTPDLPYLISSEGVLSRIANASLLWDRCFSLDADMDLTDLAWPGWGRNKGAGFAGTLAGNGHRIRNLKVNLTEPGAFHVGLFGFLTSHLSGASPSPLQRSGIVILSPGRPFTPAMLIR